uniref:Uncharacterized protein n=1 Tax=Arundo donax TaxID=35708 RepID=A0A0A9GG95_ARUDO
MILKRVNNWEAAWLGMFDAPMTVHRSSAEELEAKLVGI